MKGRKIFVGTDNMGHAAYFGWQDKGQALYMAYAKDIRTVQMTWFLLLSAATVIQKR